MVRTQTRLLGAAALCLTLAACDTPLTPTPPPSKAPPSQAKTLVPPPAGLTVSGTVVGFTATGERRPVPNLRLNVWKSGGYDGAIGAVPLPDVVTDANGRYTVPNVTTYLLFFRTAPGSEYRFLCDAYPVVRFFSSGFAFTDLPVVENNWSGNAPPPNIWISGTSVWGTVSERVNGIVQPVAGATVYFDNGGPPDPPATTSANGFYMICSVVGTDQTRWITAEKTGYHPFTREFFGGWNFVINMELTRR